jgi:hypothetical protein
MNLKEWLDGKKTYIAAAGALMVAVGSAMVAYCNGEPINYELIVSALTALAVIFLRKGIKNDIEKATD